MSVWQKLFGTTNTPRKPDALEVAFLSQSKAIEKIMAKQQELIAQQQATLDRIVTARYDRPVERTIHQVVPDQMPLWGLNDQGDVDPIGTGIQNLHVESDAEFLASVQ